MDSMGEGASVSLIATRAIHFTATTVVAGTLVFRMAVARRVLRQEKAAATAFRTWTLGVLWGGLVVAVISGAIWLGLEAISMSGLPVSEAMTANTVSTVLDETQFGQVTEIRAGLAILLAICLVCDRSAAANWCAASAALGLAASLAWTGHAGATLGGAGKLHLAADVLHLCAAAAWIGGLISLILLFAAVRRIPTRTLLAHDAALRFSILGIVSVAALSITGFVSAYMLVGSLRALFVTEYGRVLLLKLGVFAVMLAFAAINRFSLTPRLGLPFAGKAQSETLRLLTRNSAVETIMGLAVLVIVGMLGTMHPAIHLMK